AFIAGIIFAFSPMHLAQAFGGHINWTNIEFLPLFILFFLKMIHEKTPDSLGDAVRSAAMMKGEKVLGMINQKKLIYSLAAAVSFVFLLFMGDPEQGIITALFVIMLLAIYAISKSRRSLILNKEFAISFVVMGILVLILGSPFLIPISGAFTNGVLSSAGSALNDAGHNMLCRIVPFAKPLQQPLLVAIGIIQLNILHRSD
ncbi:MAG: hypothetical protein KGH71_06235, partial [Candidatus Micrarchaeota archaeon]|nr:hypothetical protein [Candidatus Micrarchaeota archaeon]